MTQIHGTYGHIFGEEMITSLTFMSNKQKYGPFGRQIGESFSTPSGKKIMGFFGRVAAYFDQIGIVVAEAPQIHQPQVNPQSSEHVNTNVASENEDWILVEGPWGVEEESNFYDGRGNIIEIEVAYNKDYILCIQTTYQQTGTIFKQEANGGQGGQVAKVRNLFF